MFSARTAASIALCFLVIACSSAPVPPPIKESLAVAPPPSEVYDNPDWSAHLKGFIEDYFHYEPAGAAMQGRHEYDGQLPDWSAEGLRKKLDWLQAQRAISSDFREFDLSPRQRFEREYLLARIDTELFWQREAEGPYRNPAYYTGSLEPAMYLSRPYAPLEQRMKAYIAYARAVPRAAAQIRANLRSPLPRTFVQLGINGFGGFPDFYRKDVPKVFAAVKDPQLQKELRAANEEAAKAMQELANWLKTQQATANDNFALGYERFANMLYMTERVSTPLSQLRAIAQADLNRNLEALAKACAQFAPGASLAECTAKEAADKPQGGAVEGARAQLTGLKQFLLDKQLVTIPGEEQALVAEAPPYQRWNFAYIDIAGPYDKGMPSVYNIAPPDPSWPKAEQLAYVPGKASLLFTSVHEVWPGHFLQFLHANRSPFLFGQIFVGYAYAEGWAHYTEEMMWDAGLGDGDPQTHIGQLEEALLRDVRFICAMGLHTQNMSVQECETLFREKAFQDPGNARQQAARGTYDPAYLNYTMGKLMIMKLRADWTATRGGREAWRAFHDQFLSYGGPPIPLVRRQMLGEKDDGRLF
ncbi:protein of unknown function [Solimonas aquatica]|uniref:DUF885 domain-containing protein n=1 Tax=Solimonas aquatica TaxID=489703 RepID=A0A1H9KYX6_9GAMM|nr:DUF885 domain-containing protein [Solimonas aquatica]SER04370.1 protein of unknown function [Solimonas aquatica]